LSAVRVAVSSPRNGLSSIPLLETSNPAYSQFAKILCLKIVICGLSLSVSVFLIGKFPCLF
jgi:hypothetical protein